MKKIQSSLNVDQDLSISEKKELNIICDGIQADIKQHINKIMSTDVHIKKDGLSTKIEAQISKAQRIPATTGFKGILNKFCNIFKIDVKSPSENFRKRLDEMKSIKAIASNQSDNNSPTPAPTTPTI